MIPTDVSARAQALAATDQSPFAVSFRATAAALDVIARNFGPYTHVGVKR